MHLFSPSNQHSCTAYFVSFQPFLLLLIPCNLLGVRLLCCSTFEHSLWVANPCIVPLLYTLECQSSNKCRANSGPVFSWEDLDWIMAASERLAISAHSPVQDLS